MATLAIAYSQPRPTPITSFRNRAGAASWTNLLRIPHGALPGGTGGDYSIFAFGHIGRFSNPSGGTIRHALVGLRFDTSSTSEIQASTLTRVPMHSTVYNDGTGADLNRGHSWCACLTVTSGNWPATTDLVVSATVEHVGGSPPHGSFYADATTVLIFDHATCDVIADWDFSTHTLPYSDVGDVVLVDGTTLPTTGQWAVFYSAQVTPQTETTPGNTYWGWITKLADGTNVDATYGIDGRAQTTGLISRVSSGSPATPPDPLVELYSMGGFYPVTVSNGTTKMQVRGFSFFAAATAIQRAVSQTAAMFAVPLSVFSDWAIDATAVVPDAFNASAWTNFQTLNVDCGDDRPKHIAIAQSTLYDDTEPTILGGLNLLTFNGGFPVSKIPIEALHSQVIASGVDHSPNYTSHIAENAPWIVRHGVNTAQLNGLASILAGHSTNAGGRFYAALSFTPTDDPDRDPPTPAAIVYTPILLTREIDTAGLPQLDETLVPDEGVAITFGTGLTSFTTEDGHTIRWPNWSKPRRGWRLHWICDEARYLALYALLHRPFDSAAVRMPDEWAEAPGIVVYIAPDTLRAQQLSGRLVWDVSCVATELVYVGAPA